MEENGEGITDYTAWRRGRRAGLDGRIAVCPKCGRKGATHIVPAQSPKREPSHLSVIHRFRALPRSSPSDLIRREVLDSCWIALPMPGSGEKS